jgi:hypothetical protein
LTSAGRAAKSRAMPSRNDKPGGVRIPRPSYTTRVHLKRRIEAIDFRFLAAVAALAAVTVAITRFY